jgi:phosphoribosylglycinamide formyltransferase-1
VKNIAVFASGAGSNARAIMEHFRGSAEVQVRLVVSNKAGAPVLDSARSMGVETLTIYREGFYHSGLLLDQLKQRHIEFIVLAGFLWLVPDYLVQAFSGRIVNIHPALLPKYGGKGMYGMRVHEAVKNAGDAHTGITIHYVNEHYDQGRIIFQARCPVEPGDSPAEIARKVQALEHRHFPAVLEQLLLGRPITGTELAD